jgi:membrane peptidoglycan carboxypeptidase
MDNTGFAAAADFYFNKKLKDVTIREAALLAALPRSPHNYFPHSKPGSGSRTTRLRHRSYGRRKEDSHPLKAKRRRRFQSISPPVSVG